MFDCNMYNTSLFYLYGRSFRIQYYYLLFYDVSLDEILINTAADIPSYYLSVPVTIKYTESRLEGGNEKLIKRSTETTYHFMKY